MCWKLAPSLVIHARANSAQVNMGHNDVGHVQQCISACPEMQSLVVLSVREPYSYWASVYGYARAGVGTSVHPCPGRGNTNVNCWALQVRDVLGTCVLCGSVVDAQW